MARSEGMEVGGEGKNQGLRHAVADEQPRLGAHPNLVGPERRDVHATLAFAIERMRGGGQPLDWKTRTRMGLTLGCDFRHVRVHTRREANRLSRQMCARAFTTGMDIFFSPGAYDPASDAGRELIAHELVHVVQQGAGRAAGTRHPLVVRPARDVFELEAEALAPMVAGTAEWRTRPRVRMTLASGAVLQRSMVQTVTAHTVIGNNRTWTDPHGVPPFPIATACHFATVYWLFFDEFKRVHTQAEVIRMGNAQLVVASMIARGTRRNNPLVGALTLTPGSVLVFVNNNQPMHSCVAIAAQTVAGYNQLGCFSAGGADHAYSAHPTNQLVWGNLANRNQVCRPGVPGWYQLYEVPEGIAKALVRQAVQ